jgi:outer membrane lipoprotein-sorting protein
MSKTSPATLLACVIALATPAAVQAEPAVLGLARTYLGPQSTLDGIQSLHFVGTVKRVDPDVATPPVSVALDMIFAKPLKQRLVITGPKGSRTTVLDGYDAWDLLRDASDPSKYRLTWLNVNDIKTLRANTWENLYYYRAPEGGQVEDKGPETIDGIACERVDFAHTPEILYIRYFDRDTGRLVLTVKGQENIRESGEIRVDGVRFPKTIVSTSKTASGKDVVTTVAFDSVTLNEVFPASLFMVPSPPPPKAPAQPAAAGK